jgi:hypothetical protein
MMCAKLYLPLGTECAGRRKIDKTPHSPAESIVRRFPSIHSRSLCNDSYAAGTVEGGLPL